MDNPKIVQKFPYKIYSEKLDLNISKNNVIIYDNAIYQGMQGEIKADNMVLDLITKDVEIFMDSPKIVQKFPYKISAESGKSYFWCSCGQSSKQPFCDGSHEGTDFLPQKVKLEDEKDIFFCGCKMSKNGAFCDGTHKDL